MKKYLVTLFSDSEISKIRNYYGNWNIDLMLDIKMNLEMYNLLGFSSVDLIYLFAKTLESGGEFGGVCSPNIFATKDGIYYFNESINDFAKFENGSDVYLWRTQMLDKEYLAFLKLYSKEAFDINFHYSYDYDNNHIGTKRFGMYWGYISSTQSHIPNSVVPMISKVFNSKILLRFLSFYKNLGDRIIIKSDESSGGKNIYIIDVADPKDRNNINGIIESMKESGKSKIVISELLDTLDFEIRLLWYKKDNEVNIVSMYKKERLEGQILHNISQGNMVKPILESEYPKNLIEEVKMFCSKLVDNHGGLDIVMAKNGNFYFTENNVLTGYLDTEIEIPFLKEWLDSVSKIYIK
ncbi:MAG: hypothetical protein PHS92_00150 [Candidatus Gracilibacteria bacterium]|nr:hypothetical protein [Candidatus Gracilibacteria bacterium]